MPLPRIALSERPSHPCGKSARPTGQDIAVPVPVPNAGLPVDNKLLASLPRDHFDRLLPHLTTVQLAQGLGLYKSLVRVVVQMPVSVSKIAATHFRTVAAGSDPVRNLCVRYNEVLLSQARVTAACNALHSIEARFCRWLLQSADRAANDTVALTQEFLAEMLGVRRTSVTEVASKVQSAGAITYSRGVIKILDRPALLRMSCECYETLVDQSAQLG